MSEIQVAWSLVVLGFLFWGPLLCFLGAIMGSVAERNRIRDIVEGYLVPREPFFAQLGEDLQRDERET